MYCLIIRNRMYCKSGGEVIDSSLWIQNICFHNFLVALKTSISLFSATRSCAVDSVFEDCVTALQIHTMDLKRNPFQNEVLQSWYARSHILLGILRSRVLRDGPDPNILVSGHRIRLIEEEDPIHNDVKRFNCLGFAIPEKCKWDDFVNQNIE